VEEDIRVSQANHEGARAYALGRLANELAPLWVYHSLVHTRDDVLPAAERLAALEGVGGEAAQLLSTAACYHDLGFIEQRNQHEIISAHMAAAALPAFGYSPSQIALIEGMILATQLPQSPRTPLEQLLADADLDVLGRSDFLALNQNLRTELASCGMQFSDVAWYTGQISFLQSHHYWTATMRRLRDRQKRQNIITLQALLMEAAANDDRFAFER
jgi:uncharacterized protein